MSYIRKGLSYSHANYRHYNVIYKKGAVLYTCIYAAEVITGLINTLPQVHQPIIKGKTEL